jgi:hypothetical protein
MEGADPCGVFPWQLTGQLHTPAALSPKPVGQEAEGPQNRTRHCEEENNVCQSGNRTPVTRLPSPQAIIQLSYNQDTACPILYICFTN